MASFQQMLPLGILPLQPGALDPTLRVMVDEPAPHVVRFTYVRLEKTVVTEMALLVTCEPTAGRPCFALGYAVPPAYRRQGRGKRVVAAALAEFESGMRRAGVLPLYIEAVVGADNAASLALAKTQFADPGETATDDVSGLPAVRFLRRID